MGFDSLVPCIHVYCYFADGYSRRDKDFGARGGGGIGWEWGLPSYPRDFGQSGVVISGPRAPSHCSCYLFYQAIILVLVTFGLRFYHFDK